ncbi:MAG: hypothetical protein IKG69_08600 [Atopobiaceae bacterium]|nr:hypothetical protein [Atopobiaceae bacterium]
MSEQRSTCIDCKFFDTEAGNIYGVCVKNSYIDYEDEFELHWISGEAASCGEFEEGDA